MRRHPGFIDFGLEVGCGAGSGYPLRISSPAGDLQSTMQFPFAERALENRMLAIEDSLIRSGSKRDLAADLAPAAPQRTIQEFGEKLFQALLAGDARSLYDQATSHPEHSLSHCSIQSRLLPVARSPSAMSRGQPRIWPGLPISGQ